MDRTVEFVDRKMTGQMDEWMDRWMAGCVGGERFMDALYNTWFAEKLMQRWIGEWEQEYLNGFMDGL